jgi:hypothetical protein
MIALQQSLPLPDLDAPLICSLPGCRVRITRSLSHVRGMPYCCVEHAQAAKRSERFRLLRIVRGETRGEIVPQGYVELWIAREAIMAHAAAMSLLDRCQRSPEARLQWELYCREVDVCMRHLNYLVDLREGGVTGRGAA